MKGRMQNPYLIFVVYNIISKVDIHQKMNNVYELTLCQRQKIRQDIPRPVWFVYEGNILYFAPKSRFIQIGIRAF